MVSLVDCTIATLISHHWPTKIAVECIGRPYLSRDIVELDCQEQRGNHAWEWQARTLLHLILIELSASKVTSTEILSSTWFCDGLILINSFKLIYFKKREPAEMYAFTPPSVDGIFTQLTRTISFAIHHKLQNSSTDKLILSNASCRDQGMQSWNYDFA